MINYPFKLNLINLTKGSFKLISIVNNQNHKITILKYTHIFDKDINIIESANDNNFAYSTKKDNNKQVDNE